MNERLPADFADIRHAMARFSPAPKVEPGTTVLPEQVFMPESHRSVLDLERQLVVGNRGMGKSFWTCALENKDVCNKIAVTYGLPKLARTEVVVGFNGSEKLSVVAPTPDAIRRAMEGGSTADEIWRSVMFRAVRKVLGQPENEHLDSTLAILKAAPSLFEETLSVADNSLASTGKTILILFDALDRLAADWTQIRLLTVSLLRRALGLKSFQSFRTKIFIRPDQFSDPNLFRFPDASKLKNEHVDLSWQPKALFDLLFFEISRDERAGRALDAVASEINAHGALRSRTHFQLGPQDDQRLLINALAGSYMGTNARRGRVYTWVPLHLSDAHGACSPRTFLTAWQKGAEQGQAPTS